MSSGGPVLVAAGLALAASACTYASHVAPYEQPAAAPLLVTIATNPAARSDGTVPRNTRFVVQLDGYPDPDSVGFGPVTLRSGRGSFDIAISVDLVGRAVLVTPRSLLAPGTQYDLVISGLATLDNRVQVENAVGSVLVGQDDGDPFPAPPRPTWTADIEPLLGSCAKFCHSSKGLSGRTRTPTSLLDITPAVFDGTPDDPRDSVLGLVAVPSVGLRGTPVPLVRVAPGDPSRSVLLRKLIGGSPQADSKDPPYPSMRVDGRRMPIPLDEAAPADAPFTDDQLRLVQDWIIAGAPTD